MPAHRESLAPELALELSDLAATVRHGAGSAPAVLELLHRAGSFDAGFVSLFDPQDRRQLLLHSHGHSARVQQFLASPMLIDDFEQLSLLRAHQRPVQVNETIAARESVRGWWEYMRPAGFGRSVGLALTTADGRHLGNIGLQSATEQPPDDAYIELLHRLTRLIARVFDPLRTVSAISQLVTDAYAGMILTRSGEVIPLSGLPDDLLLAAGSPVLSTVAARLHDGLQMLTFLCPTSPGAPTLTRVTALACPPHPLGRLRSVVLLSPPPPRHGLTIRELQVLGLLVDGYSNNAIAAALNLAARTAVAHIEHIMIKMVASSRTVAAVRALRQGLYIPADLDPAGRQAAAR
ncbi:LuxR C-terminal-related transcriptional regulator [Actinoplanes awajinensis]|uniref:HTH luxR-type domain-containing protein n=1 Tax=Actinoplanes awajinensis subsp. mycoplanecinus TaxID=135947 RepID=A0A101JM61_9ACTN|nr:LuxR C-terminal-related transcriptional regulator [Actinoplanes awajinensis]KUL29443.1 hypothetical protein ADL15_27895 [Actinoplanes awajinensis subsp. mycoplanecinus]